MNIGYHLSDEVLEKLPETYKAMPGWISFGNGVNGEEGIPYWFSFDEDEKHLSVSIEPSGLTIEGQMKESEWLIWKAEFKSRASEILGFKVGEPEEDEVEPCA